MKGATRVGLRVADLEDVSIHAPVKGATTRHRRLHGQRKRFNPRAREGRDAVFCAPVVEHRRFNPRAREGRDFGWSDDMGLDISFNPRAREGRDLAALTALPALAKFQSTRP